MKFTNTLTLVAVTLSLGLGACTTRVVQNDKVQITANAAMDAEQLALAGEQLVSPYTFHLADQVLDMALIKDPFNKRAQLYKAFVKRFMVLKGVLTRIRPLEEKYANIEAYDKFVSGLPYSPIRDFLLAGPSDIVDETGVQDLIAQERNAVLDFRKFVRDNLNLEIALNLNPLLFQGEIQQQYMKSCKVVESSDHSLTVVCDYREVAQKKLNMVDMLALSQMASYEVLAYTLYNSYSLNGYADLAKKYSLWGSAHSSSGSSSSGGGSKVWSSDTQDEVATPEKIFTFLESNPGFGKLRGDNSLGTLRGLGADLVGAFKWAMANQAAACPANPNPAPTPNPWEPPYYSAPYVEPRPGFLFPNGFCAHQLSYGQETMALLEIALNGIIPVEFRTINGPQKLNTDMFAPARKPVADLRSVLPSKYNSCGKPIALRDVTLGGLFPEGNGELLLNDQTCEPTK